MPADTTISDQLAAGGALAAGGWRLAAIIGD
jgi:hypothetical protein